MYFKKAYIFLLIFIININCFSIEIIKKDQVKEINTNKDLKIHKICIIAEDNGDNSSIIPVINGNILTKQDVPDRFERLTWYIDDKTDVIELKIENSYIVLKDIEVHYKIKSLDQSFFNIKYIVNSENGDFFNIDRHIGEKNITFVYFEEKDLIYAYKIKEILKEYQNKDNVSFIITSFKDTLRINRFLKENKISNPCFIDIKQRFKKRFKIDKTPFTINISLNEK